MNKTNKKGQALLESLMLFVTFTMIVFAIGWFSRVLLTRQQLLMAARYGTDLIVYTTLNTEQVKNEIKDYLGGREAVGRKLDIDNFKNNDINVIINREKSDSIRIYSFDEVKNYSSYVELRYGFNLPPIINKAAGGRRFYVSARSEVLAGTGCKGDSY
ncbi:MAG: pilus assembly protein [Endomicrobiales bacterium]|nr:pilus assembly protein [Endomicrobiales bacterium]